MPNGTRFAVFGGQYGSEGKGCVAEFLARTQSGPIVAIAENGPNAGHQNTIIKTRILPSCAIFAHTVFIGPDACIDPKLLEQEMHAVYSTVGQTPAVFIHERAAIVTPDCCKEEHDTVLKSISSTGTGSGVARKHKYIERLEDAIIWAYREKISRPDKKVEVVPKDVWWSLLTDVNHESCWIFEGSQGFHLDPSWGIYPYVTSRNTDPRVAIARLGLTDQDWMYCAAYRPHPIRTGGPSGHCEGVEISWASLGVKEEITAVTRRVRRVFAFNAREIELTRRITKPDMEFWTHLDYLNMDATDTHDRLKFRHWLSQQSILAASDTMVSSKPSEFYKL